MYEYTFRNEKGEAVPLKGVDDRIKHLDDGWYDTSHLIMGAFLGFAIKERKGTITRSDLTRLEEYINAQKGDMSAQRIEDNITASRLVLADMTCEITYKR